MSDITIHHNPPHDELGPGDPARTDGQPIDAMLRHPILMDRPIVATQLAILPGRKTDGRSTAGEPPATDGH